MAREEEPRFKYHVKLDHDSTVTPSNLIGSRVNFQLQIRLFLTDDDGNIVGEGAADGLQDRSVLLEIEFGRQRHRSRVANILRAAGWRDDEWGLRRFLDEAFSEAKLKLERAKTNSRSNPGVPSIIFCVSKFVKVELPKPVPAARESIQALKKLKLEADSGQKQECMICMGQLCSETEVSSMPCSHLFHGECIEKWLNMSHNCPLCRFPMPTDV